MRKREAAEARCTADIGTATLNEMMLRYEKTIVRQALVSSQGSVTRAAFLLGVSHQRLIYILKTRHRDLLSIRTPVKTRKRSIITKREELQFRQRRLRVLPNPNAPAKDVAGEKKRKT